MVYLFGPLFRFDCTFLMKKNDQSFSYLKLKGKDDIGFRERRSMRFVVLGSRHRARRPTGKRKENCFKSEKNLKKTCEGLVSSKNIKLHIVSWTWTLFW
jgi:hypothetical protein